MGLKSLTDKAQTMRDRLHVAYKMVYEVPSTNLPIVQSSLKGYLPPIFCLETQRISALNIHITQLCKKVSNIHW